MGFLGDLLKKEAKKVVSNAIDNVTGSFTGSSSEKNDYSSAGADKTHAKRNEEGGGEAGFRDRFEEIIAEEWPGYELVQNVSAYDFGAEDGARDYSYGLYYNGEPKAMIMIIRGSNEYRKSEVVKAMNACERQGIVYLNFMVYFPNRRDYISNRLKEEIG